MRPEVQLYIQGPDDVFKIVDLDGVESMSLTQRFTDITNFGTTGAFTQSFRIPSTPNNNAIFGIAQDANIVSIEGFFKKLRARIDVSTFPFAQGHVQLINTYKKVGKQVDFEITFYGETPDFVKAVGDKKLKDIIDLPSLNHVVNTENVTTDTDNYIYGLVDRGQKWSELGESGTRPVLNLTYSVFPGDLTCFVNWLYIFQQILKDSGFTYIGATLDTALAGYWMPWLNSQYPIYAEPYTQFLFRAALSAQSGNFFGPPIEAQVISVVEEFDNNDNFSDDSYTAPFTGWFTFRVWATAGDSDTQEISVELKIISDGNVIWSGPQATAHNHFYETTPLFADVGDVFQLGIKFYSNGGTLAGVPDSYTEGTGFELIFTSAALSGGTIDMPLNAPDMLQIDFLRDVVKIHNLAVVPDRLITNKLILEPMISYLGSGAERDWTGKLDLNKDISLKPTTEYQKQINTWTYKAGGDVLSQLFTNAGGTYGDYRVEGLTTQAGEEANQFAQGENKTELVTASTPSNTISGTTIVIPKFISSSGEFVAPGPRVLYQASTASIAVYDDDTETGVMYSVNLMNNYSAINAEVDDFDLNWAPETPLHTITANPYNNLYRQWWMDYINGIYSPQARILEAYFALELIDMLGFSFADEIFIVDSWWRILEISEHKIGMNESTKVVLIKVINPNPDCDLRPFSSSLGGIITFVDNADDPSFGTEVCCTRYGYTWNGVTERCHAFESDDGRPRGSFEQGTDGVGFQSGGNAQRSRWVIAVANRLGLSADVTLSLIAGSNITVADGNQQLIVVGRDLEVTGLNRVGAYFGRNGSFPYPGWHLAGGSVADNFTDPKGRIQTGIMLMAGDGEFTVSGTNIEIFVEGKMDGVTDDIGRLVLPENCSWNVTLEVSVQRFASGVQTTGYATFIGHISKDTQARVGTFATVGSAEFNTLTLTIDGSTNNTQHRILISAVGGAGYPYTNIKITAALKYTQVQR